MQDSQVESTLAKHETVLIEHVYHLWIYACSVCNVNVNDHSLLPQTLVNVVYLQQRKIEVSLLIKPQCVQRQPVALEEGGNSHICG